jgi:hypothetical protein
MNQETEFKYFEVDNINGKKIFGKELSSEKINLNLNLNIEDYQPGIYIIKIRTSTSSIIRKFCKR